MRLIDADALDWKYIEEEYCATIDTVRACMCLVLNAPTIDPFKDKSLEQLMDECFNRGYQKAVRHGKWIRDGIDKWRCSVCGVGNNYAYEWSVRGEKMQDNYCPNCGADMRGEQDDKR